MADDIRFPRPPRPLRPELNSPTQPAVRNGPLSPIVRPPSSPTVHTGPIDIFHPLPLPHPPAPPVLPEGFVVPAFEMQVPDRLLHPPTMNDVVVRKGFDGRTPDEALEQVLQNLGNPLDPQNRSFVERTILHTHKVFTLSVNNALTVGGPLRPQLERMAQAGAQVTVVGTMSAEHPVVYEVSHPNQEPQRFVTGPGGTLQRLSAGELIAPAILRADLHFRPDGVRIQYPLWNAPVLAAPTGTVTEG